MKNLKKLTILHSNDMHGDFMAQEKDEKLIGGVSMLSGYLNKVRKEEKNVLYTISGDMFRGNVIDSEYKGMSTIEMMNMLAPDVVTLGNHEADYGIAHLLFLEKCARFPIVNANLYLTTTGVRLFKSHYIKEIDGMKIMFIGILTEQVLSQAKQDRLVGAFVDVREAATEIGKICNAHKSDDIDFTVLLTHIGFEEDKKLAELLDPNWGVDVIIGGHSHTLLEEPAVVNNIPIVQAATGTDQVGRFDIMIDTDNNCIDSYEWNLIPIDDTHCPRDPALEEVIEKYVDATDEKYGRYITRFAEKYIEAAFLISGKHCPYYKWSLRAMKALPRFCDCAEKLDMLLSSGTADEKGSAAAIEELCDSLIKELIKDGLCSSCGDYLEPYAYKIRDRISSGELRNMPIVV